MYCHESISFSFKIIRIKIANKILQLKATVSKNRLTLNYREATWLFNAYHAVTEC